MEGQILLGLLTLALVGTARVSGQSCYNNGREGACAFVWDCPAAQKLLSEGSIPVRCNQDRRKVCCAFESYKPPSNLSPSYGDDDGQIHFQNAGDVVSRYPYENSVSCEPLSPEVTAPKTGRKAWDKCIEYQEKLIYPCQDSLLINDGRVRGNHCNWKPGSLILKGEEANLGEFPHMALLGYGNDTTEFMCGGIIVSEKFILTAGHCTSSRFRGPVVKIKIGIHRRSDRVTAQNEYNVAGIFKGPGYKPPVVYNDIALLETDRPMALNRYAVPACLHDGSPMNEERAIVTGWGTTVARQKAEADTLQKVTLIKFPDYECIEKFQPYQTAKYMPNGFNTATQICYGDRVEAKDSCQGDSGGPIQVKHPRLHCMYSVIGVISWGKWCGKPGEPGVYTRVSYFIPWIESIVWP